MSATLVSGNWDHLNLHDSLTRYLPSSYVPANPTRANRFENVLAG